MSLELRTVVPRPSADPMYMQRLRDRAMVRLREEERAAGVVMAGESPSRRGFLGRFGILLAGFVPGVAALVKGQAALAAPVGSVRSCAPQYGAPSWYPPVTSYPAPPNVKFTTSFAELADMKLWKDTSVAMVPRKGSRLLSGYGRGVAKVAYYGDPWGGGPHELMAIIDSESGYSYVVRGGQTFYCPEGTHLYGYFLGGGVLSVAPSYFETKTVGGGFKEAIEGFSKVAGRAAEIDRQTVNINLEKGLPQEFWIKNNVYGWSKAYVSVAHAELVKEGLRLELVSEGCSSPAVFFLDLKAKALIRTQFDGREWAAAA